MQVCVLDEITVCATRITIAATTSHRIVTKEREKDGPSCKDDDISIQCGTVFKQQSSRRKFLDGPVTFQLDLPVNDQLRSTDVLEWGSFGLFTRGSEQGITCLDNILPPCQMPNEASRNRPLPG